MKLAKNHEHNGRSFTLTAPPEVEKRGPGRPPLEGESIQSARRRKECALADLRQLEVARRKGELLDADAVTREWGAIVRQARAALLAVPSRVRARLPHLSAHDAGVIDREIRTALEALGTDHADPE